jgi:hypothetical protein
MIAKVKTPVFIDALTVEFSAPPVSSLRAILRDDQGLECIRMETEMVKGSNSITWKGLNDLPYGVYTLELFSHGEDEMKMRLVKRV